MGENDDKAVSIEISLIDSIAEAEMKGLAADAGEVALDAVLDDSLLESIPVAGTVARLYRTAVSIRDRLFLKKVLSFLSEFSGVERPERQRFATQLETDEGSRARAGAALTLLLDRLNDLDKPRIIGRLYRARLDNRLSFAELRRFCMIVEYAHLPDLVELARLPEGQRVDNVAAPFLHALGLVGITGEDYGTFDGIGAETWYEVNERGRKFLTLAFAK